MSTQHPLVYVFFYVDDLGAARRFYEEKLGLSVIELDERAVKYDAGEVILALNVAADYGKTLSGEDRTQLFVFHVDDVDGKRAELEERGISFTGPTERYEIGATATFFDPDGHCLLLYQPSDESLTWPSGDDIRRILAADSRSRTMLGRLEAHRSGSPREPRPLELAKMIYVFLYITNLAEARRFYGDQLGLPILEEDAGVGVVKYDGGGVIVATHLIETQPNATRGEHMDVSRSSALVLHTPDLRADYERLREAGVPFSGEIRDGDIGRIAAFHDPDGHNFYLYEPSPAALSWPSGTKIGHLTGSFAARV